MNQDMLLILQNIQIMEERIKISFLGQEITLEYNQIILQQPIVNENHINELKIPFVLGKFKVNLQVLHACLYYLIAIEKNIRFPSSIDFREKCLAAIETYYIKLKMSFQLYEYGFLISRILAYSLQKTLHIIYFLIYARLASKPYIINVIAQFQNKKRHLRKKTTKSEKQYSIMSGQNESRHYTIFMDNSQMQVQNFKRELKKVFTTQSSLKKISKKTQNKRCFNLKKLYPSEDFQSKFQEKEIEPVYSKSSSASRIQSIPLKAGANDHSSVINRLKFHSGKSNIGQRFQTSQLLMRRQKFNVDFDASIKYEGKQKGEESELKKEWTTQRLIGDEKSKGSNIYRIQKHPYEYFKQMTQNIKSKNKQLDMIRSQCYSSNNHLKSILARKDADSRHERQGYEPKTQNRMLFAHNLAILTKKQIQKMEDKENVQEKNGHRQSEFKIDLTNKKQNQNLRTEPTNRVSDPTSSIITRKTNQFIQQDEQLSLFGRKMKNQFKLQKYKQDYRHFLKTQMFEKVQNII